MIVDLFESNKYLLLLLLHVVTSASVRRASTKWNVRVVVVPSAAQKHSDDLRLF